MGYTFPADGFFGLEAAAVAGDVGAGGINAPRAGTAAALRISQVNSATELSLRQFLGGYRTPPCKHAVA